VGKRVGILILLLIVIGLGVVLGSLVGGSQPDSSSEDEPPAVPVETGRVRVEILNASGVSGIAREATGWLRDKGFDVVYYGNAGTYGQDPSVVIDRVGNPAVAQLIAGALGIPGIRTEADSTLLVDITVLLGPEWVAPEGEGGKVEDPPAWWDLRRFFRKDEPNDPEHP
jgi:hypothetical protein